MTRLLLPPLVFGVDIRDFPLKSLITWTWWIIISKSGCMNIEIMSPFCLPLRRGWHSPVLEGEELTKSSFSVSSAILCISWCGAPRGSGPDLVREGIRPLFTCSCVQASAQASYCDCLCVSLARLINLSLNTSLRGTERVLCRWG